MTSQQGDLSTKSPQSLADVRNKKYQEALKMAESNYRANPSKDTVQPLLRAATTLFLHNQALGVSNWELLDRLKDIPQVNQQLQNQTNAVDLYD